MKQHDTVSYIIQWFTITHTESETARHSELHYTMVHNNPYWKWDSTTQWVTLHSGSISPILKMRQQDTVSYITQWFTITHTENETARHRVQWVTLHNGSQPPILKAIETESTLIQNHPYWKRLGQGILVQCLTVVYAESQRDSYSNLVSRWKPARQL